MGLFIAYNGNMPTTTAIPKVATGAAIKTMMQLKQSANSPMEIVEWGISFDAAAAIAPGTCELIETGTVNATVTTYNAADVMPYDDATATLVSLASLGTAASGFTATVEGSITATRVFDTQLIDPAFGPYVKQFPQQARPKVKAGNILRVRVTFGTTVNALCYVLWLE
jgi:hypothetical protein